MSGVVDRIQDLARPAVDLTSQLRDQGPHPRLDRLESNVAVIRFAGPVIGASDNEIVSGTRPRIEPHVVVGIRRVPVERIGQ